MYMYMCCCVRVYSYFKVTNKPYEAGCIGQCKYCISNIDPFINEEGPSGHDPIKFQKN